ncbi:MAG: cysteine synthase A [Candidatus Methanomethylophilaceae archaeon]|nr:cysteine synthase A [Candidatus Methanomethylophilaceae archaeon]
MAVPMIHTDVLKTIGETPIIRLNRMGEGLPAEIFVKMESRNPGGSIKDRVALSMVEDAESRGIIQPGDSLVEPTSGNTGIGLAMVAAVKGYRAVLVMPESMSVERRTLLKAYGAELVLTPASEGMTGAVAEAERLAGKDGYYMPQQFRNPSNPMAHYVGTAREILRDLPGVRAVVCGIGTGGTITGIGRAMQNFKSDVRIIGVEPAESPLISEGKAASHRIEGIGANFIPPNLDRRVLDEVLTISYEDALQTTRRLAREEGILAGISSGAALKGALAVASRMNPGEQVLVVLPDSGERYLSTPLFKEEGV